MDSLKRTSIDGTKNGLAAFVGLVSTTTGANVSGTTVKVRGADVVALPPVSVAIARTVRAVPPTAMAGVVTSKSHGNDTSRLTTWPLTSRSTLLTCTSSVTVGITWNR